MGFTTHRVTRTPFVGWFRDHPDALLAIPTGHESGLLILDIDPPGADWYHANATDLKCGYVVRTQRGHHLYYTLPAGIEIGRRIGWLPGVDVLGGDGYAIAWFAHGYEAIGDMDDIGPPPPWLLEQLQKGNGNSRNSRLRSGNGSAKITESYRNNHLTQLAGMLASQGYDEAAICASLRAENAQRLDPPLEDSELQKTVLKSVRKWVARNETVEKRQRRRSRSPCGDPSRRHRTTPWRRWATFSDRRQNASRTRYRRRRRSVVRAFWRRLLSRSRHTRTC